MVGCSNFYSPPYVQSGYAKYLVSFPSFFGQLDMAMVGVQKLRGAIIVSKKKHVMSFRHTLELELELEIQAR